MAQQIINTGAYRNDPNADPMWIGGTKINENFAELYSLAQIGASQTVIYASQRGVTLDSNVLTGGGTDATSAIQAILDTADTFSGGICLVIDGAGLISAPLVVKSNTTIYCPNWGCGLYLASGSNCEMIHNEATVYVNNGLGFPDSIPNPKDKNIFILGGTWNQNGKNQTKFVYNSPNGPFNLYRITIGMVFSGVENITVQGVRMIESKTWANLFAFCDYVSVQDFRTEWVDYENSANHDSVHFWGPLEEVYIRNLISINGDDDVLALNYAEAKDVFPSFTFPDGYTCLNTLIDGVYAKNCQSIMRLSTNYPNATAGKLTVKNVVATINGEGPTSNGAILTGQYDRVFCENWDVTYDETALFTTRFLDFHPTKSDSDVIFKDINFVGPNATHNVIDAGFLNGTGKGHRLVLDNFRASKPVANVSASLFHFLDQQDGNGLDILEIRNCSLQGYAAAIQNDSSVGNIATITWENNLLGGAKIYSDASTKILNNVNPRTYNFPCSGWTNTSVNGSYTPAGPTAFVIQTGTTTGSSVLASANPIGVAPVGQNDSRAIDWNRPVAAEWTVAPNGVSATTTIRLQAGEQDSKTTVTDLDAKGMGVIVTNTDVKLEVHNGTTLTVSSPLALLPTSSPFTPTKFKVQSLGNGTVQLYMNNFLVNSITGGPTGAGVVGRVALNASVANNAGTSNLQLIVSECAWMVSDEMEN